MLTWLDSDPTCGMTLSKKRGNVGWGKGSLVHANGVTISGKSEICIWHGHPVLTKRRYWLPVVRGYEIPLFIGCACVGPLLRTHASLSMLLMSIFLFKDCSPHSGRVTLYVATLTSTCSLSLLQPLHSTTTVLGFK